MAGKPNLYSILTIADPMLSDNFELIFPTVPSLSGSGNTESLRLQCKTATKPGMTLEQVTYDLFGHTVEFGGRLTYSHTMTVEFVENWQGTITRNLENWLEMCRTHQSQHGHFKAQYVSTATLNIYNQVGDISLAYKIFNMFPTEIPELSFDGSAATALSLSATFSFDYHEVLTDNNGNGKA
jgi:hypothetical protein